MHKELSDHALARAVVEVFGGGVMLPGEAVETAETRLQDSGELCEPRPVGIVPPGRRRGVSAPPQHLPDLETT